MAGSRLEKIGTVFTRVRDLMRSGVMKPHEKPIWFDVYEAFPPKRSPVYVQPHRQLGAQKQETVPDIFYPEDRIRAKFYKVYSTEYRGLELWRSNHVSICQRFVDKYEELQKSTDLDEDALFEETGKRLLALGVILRRKEHAAGAPVNRDAVMDMKLKDMLAEQQSLTTEEESTEDPPPATIV